MFIYKCTMATAYILDLGLKKSVLFKCRYCSIGVHRQLIPSSIAELVL